MSTDKRFSHESLQDAKTIKTLLTALPKGVAKGEISLGDEDDLLLMQTAERMRLQGERLDGRCTVSLRVSWADPETPQTSTTGRPRI
ncbi:amphi-Trp domain-containing protein [Sagittula sp. NFXS13]|uniref:amphi-Trp domain-containing protein n=1 Tax=Sagittula sp. NFXS13 TaxID=2819095 RepID=UPI0032DEBAED